MHTEPRYGDLEGCLLKSTIIGGGGDFIQTHRFAGAEFVESVSGY